MIIKSQFVWLSLLALSIVLVAAACGDEPTPTPTAEASTETGTDEPTPTLTAEASIETDTDEPTPTPTAEASTETGTDEPTPTPTAEASTETGTYEPTPTPTSEASNETGTDEPTPTPTSEASNETGIKVPSGFEVVEYFGGLDHPTSMAIGPDRKLYVTLQSGDVISLTDEDSDGVADRQTFLISGLILPLGITFVGDEAYVSARGQVVKVVDDDGDGISEGLEIIISGLPVGGELHANVQNNAITMGPDGFLHVSIGIDVESRGIQSIPTIDPARAAHLSGGSSSGEAQGTDLGLNTGLVGSFVANELAGTIIRFRPDGSDLQIFASGFENPYGLAFDDQGNLFATDIGPDHPEGPDELNYVVQGADYGAPKEFGARNLPGDIPAIAELEVAGTSGLSIYLADQFPKEYKGNAFIAQWGQAIGDVPNGNRIVRVIMTKVDDRFDGVVRTFAVGFQHPISTVVAPDGSLFVADWGSLDFSDTESGAIYRISVER